MLREECGRSLGVIKSRLDLLLKYLLGELQVLVLCKEIAAWGITGCARQEVKPDYHKSSSRPFKSTSPPTKALMWYRLPQNFQNLRWSRSLSFQWWKVEKSLGRSLQRGGGGFSEPLSLYILCASVPWTNTELVPTLAWSTQKHILLHNLLIFYLIYLVVCIFYWIEWKLIIIIWCLLHPFYDTSKVLPEFRIFFSYSVNIIPLSLTQDLL